MTTVPSDVSCCIVDAMRVVKMMPITNLTPPAVLGCAKRLYNYMKQLPGTVIHIVFDGYEEEGHLNSLSKERQTKPREIKIAALSQQLPRVNEWTDFLTNSKNKSLLTLFLADFYLTESKNMGKDVYVTKRNQCYQSTVKVPNNQVPDIKSNHRKADPRITLHTILLHQLTNQVQFVLLQIIRTYVSRCYMCLSIALEKCTFEKVLVHPMMKSPTMMWNH